jgi:rRNA maturation endonuclease Nob1
MPNKIPPEQDEKKDVLERELADVEDVLPYHENIRCRVCRIVDGYTDQEKFCKHCGAELVKQDRMF